MQTSFLKSLPLLFAKIQLRTWAIPLQMTECSRGPNSKCTLAFSRSTAAALQNSNKFSQNSSHGQKKRTSRSFSQGIAKVQHLPNWQPSISGLGSCRQRWETSIIQKTTKYRLSFLLHPYCLSSLALTTKRSVCLWRSVWAAQRNHLCIQVRPSHSPRNGRRCTIPFSPPRNSCTRKWKESKGRIWVHRGRPGGTKWPEEVYGPWTAFDKGFILKSLISPIHLGINSSFVHRMVEPRGSFLWERGKSYLKSQRNLSNLDFSKKKLWAWIWEWKSNELCFTSSLYLSLLFDERVRGTLWRRNNPKSLSQIVLSLSSFIPNSTSFSFSNPKALLSNLRKGICQQTFQ